MILVRRPTHYTRVSYRRFYWHNFLATLPRQYFFPISRFLPSTGAQPLEHFLEETEFLRQGKVDNAIVLAEGDCGFRPI